MLTLIPITTPSLNFVGDVAHSLLRDGTSAFAASALATTLLHPLDTLKTRIQSQRYRVGANGAVVRTRPRRELLTDLHAHAAHAPAHPHTRQQQRERAQLQPLFADLYTGLGSNILKEAPDAAVYLALYQCLSQALLADEFGWWASHATLALLVAGAAGDAAGSVLRLPAEVACKRLQTGVAAGGDALQALGDVPRSDWLASWAAILARDVPLGGLQVAIYAEAQHSLHTTMEALQAAAPDSAADVLAGVLAGGLAAALTNPLDVVVTHCATQEGGGGRGPLGLASDLVHEQGVGTLARGVGLRIAYYAPLVGAWFGLYEAFRGALDSVGQ